MFARDLDKLFPQVFNGQLFFTNTGVTDFAQLCRRNSGVQLRRRRRLQPHVPQSNSAIFAQDDWKATSTLTVNLGLRTEFLGAWTDGDCHIGNIESDLTNSGTYPFIYPKCVEQAGSDRIDRERCGLDV